MTYRAESEVPGLSCSSRMSNTNYGLNAGVGVAVAFPLFEPNFPPLINMGMDNSG